MPLKNGHLTTKERIFVDAVAVSDNPKVAATVAGYKTPRIDGWRLANDPRVMEASREAGQALLREKGGAVGVGVLMSIALDEKQPAGARTTAATNLVKLSGMAVTESQGEKDLHEMTGPELTAHHAKLVRQAEAMAKALAERAKPVIDGQTAQETPNALD
jgi:phage terminase small subunit